MNKAMETLLKTDELAFSQLLRETLFPTNNTMYKLERSHLATLTSLSAPIALALRKQIQTEETISNKDWINLYQSRMLTDDNQEPLEISSLPFLASMLLNLKHIIFSGALLEASKDPDVIQSLADNLNELAGLSFEGASEAFLNSHSSALQSLVANNSASLGYLKIEKCADFPSYFWDSIEYCCIDSLSLVSTACSGILANNVTLNQSLLSLHIDGHLAGPSGSDASRNVLEVLSSCISETG